MKKAKLYLMISIAAFLIATIVLFIIPTPNVIFPGQVTAGQIYDDKDINCQLSDDDSEKCKELFTGKWCYLDNPSCGFNDKVYIQIGINKFLPACDGCPIIKNGSKYFTLTEKERKTLDKILKKYGINFPCV